MKATITYTGNCETCEKKDVCFKAEKPCVRKETVVCQDGPLIYIPVFMPEVMTRI